MLEPLELPELAAEPLLEFNELVRSCNRSLDPSPELEVAALPEIAPLAEPCAFCDWSLEGWLEVSVEYWDPAPPVAVLLLFWLEELLLLELPEIDPLALPLAFRSEPLVALPLGEVLPALELEPGVELEPEIEVLL